MQVYRRTHAITETWPHRASTGLRQPQPSNPGGAGNPAPGGRMRAEWLGLRETPAICECRADASGGAHAPLAEQLEQRLYRLVTVSARTLTYARTRNVSKIVGGPLEPRWRKWCSVGGDAMARNRTPSSVNHQGGHDASRPPSRVFRNRQRWSAYGWCSGLSGCTARDWMLLPVLEKRTGSRSTDGGSRLAMRCGAWPR